MSITWEHANEPTRRTARRADETLVDYLMRLSAIVGTCNAKLAGNDYVVPTVHDGEDEGEWMRRTR